MYENFSLALSFFPTSVFPGHRGEFEAFPLCRHNGRSLRSCRRKQISNVVLNKPLQCSDLWRNIWHRHARDARSHTSRGAAILASAADWCEWPNNRGLANNIASYARDIHQPPSERPRASWRISAGFVRLEERFMRQFRFLLRGPFSGSRIAVDRHVCITYVLLLIFARNVTKKWYTSLKNSCGGLIPFLKFLISFNAISIFRKNPSFYFLMYFFS